MHILVGKKVRERCHKGRGGEKRRDLGEKKDGKGGRGKKNKKWMPKLVSGGSTGRAAQNN